MSFLFLKGLKQGDTQMTAYGLLMAGLFFVISQAKPIPRLSASRPPTSVFDVTVLLSILGQCIIHIGCLYVASHICEQYVVAGAPARTLHAETFSPNLINTATYLLSLTILINNFVVNYYGHPFMQSLSENTLLHRSVIGLYVTLLVLVGGQFEPLNDLLELVNFSKVHSSITGEPKGAELQAYIFALMLTSAFGGWLVENVTRSMRK